jgi:DegV family protein with EDD domain
MADIAIVTDSLASMPKELIDQYDIKVAPQVLIWGEETYLDQVDITPSEFYARLATAEIMPTSSQATLASFREIYEPLVEQGKKILTVVASSKLTQTINSAQQAKAMFPDATIEIVDTFGCAMSQGWQVLAVARALEAGKSFEELVELAKRAKEHTGVIFVVDTLEFLHRGGRIGGASRLLGTALNIKPLLELQEGSVEPLEKVRTRTKALQRFMDIIEERIAGRTPLRVSALHVDAEQEAEEVLEQAIERYNPDEAFLSEASPVVGVHAGPGTVGIAYCAGL